MCALRKRKFSARREFGKFLQDGKFPKLGKFPILGKFPGIPTQEFPGREKFEAIWEGGNGNFPLNITVLHKLLRNVQMLYSTIAPGWHLLITKPIHGQQSHIVG